MEIFVSLDLNESQIARLRDIAGVNAIQFHGEFTRDAPVEISFVSSEIVLGNVPSGWLTTTTALRWMQLESVGFGEYLQHDWDELGKQVTVTNLAGFFAEPVAESALAGILALYRGIDRVVQLQQTRDWQGDGLRRNLKTLHGANVVLFGFGSINQRFAELLTPFRCEVKHFGRDWTPRALDAALSEADVIVATAPETPATIGVFDEARLGLCKDSAVLVNFGRGSVVAEDALAKALLRKQLSGAVVDVTMREPLPEDHLFWTCPNIIISQHSGGGTADEMDRKIAVFAHNLARYCEGQPLVGVVDFARGY